MRVEQITIPLIRSVVNRPKLSEILFRFDPWGNPLGPDRYSWPYPIYDRMRQDGAVAYRGLYQQWFVMGHAEARAALSSPSMVVEPQVDLMKVVRPFNRFRPAAASFLDNLLVLTDPPDHTRLRRLVSRTFSPRQMARMEQAVDTLAQRLVDEALDAAHNGGSTGAVEIFSSFAAPLPIQVICELLGVPEERWEWAAHISTKISLIGNVMVGFDPEEVSAAVDDMQAYFLDLAAQRRVEPTEDLVSALAEVDEDGDRLSDDEFIGMVGLLMFAGHDTTSGLITNSILALADHPEQRKMVRDNPGLWDNAIDELLRWDTPVQIIPRVAAEDVVIGDQSIKKGTNLLVMPAAANRDPARYEDPNVLRLDREDPQPVSFGHGLHHCLGHALARMEAKAALSAFVDGFGDYTYDPDSLEWKQSVVTRGTTKLMITPG